MKKISWVNLGFLFAGSFLGAGYVSGQELYQFFASYGISGAWGLLASAFLFFIFGTVLILLCQKTKISRMDEIVIFTNSSFLKNLVGFIQSFFLFGVYIIMCAGAGALLEQIFSIPSYMGSGIFCLAIFFISLKGMNGVIDVFSFFVPPLILGAVIIAVIVGFKYGYGFRLAPQISKNPLTNNWLISSIIYVSYNLTTSIGVFAPVGVKTTGKSCVYKGILFGCVILLTISSFVILSVVSVPESANFQLPMLYIASKISYFLGIAYAILLLGAMFGTSLSSIVALNEYIREKRKIAKKSEHILLFVFSVCSWVLSIYGFDNLIGTVYPICGYMGLFALGSILLHYIKVRKK